MPHIIEAYKYFPSCAGALLPVDNFRECGTCGFKVFFNPTFNASVIFRDLQGRVMLSWRTKGPITDCWQLNGGFVDPNEEPVDAAARHANRELGIPVNPQSLVITTSLAETYEYQGFTRDIVCEYYLCLQPITEAAMPQTTEESGEVRFFSQGEIPWESIGYESDKRALRALLNIG